MGFWSNYADHLGLKPVHSAGDFFQDAAALLTLGAYQADENRFQPFGFTNPVSGLVGAGFDTAIQNSVSTSMDGILDSIGTMRENSLGDYVGNLFQTDADAALDQALLNEDAAIASWKRSEESADKAQARARELRQTYYSDLMKGLKDAGLNPVLAASGGFGGVSSSAPLGVSQASSSSKADGLNAATLIQAIASILSGAGNLVAGLNPLKSSTSVDSNGALSRTFYSYGKR